MRLGQHFLKNKAKLRKIAEALELKSGDVVIEIGPGHGELTKELRIKNYGLRIIAIEKDENLAKNLEFRIKNLGLKNITIIKGDVLKIIPQLANSYVLTPKFYKVVGNIPYYITGHLLRVLGELKNKPKLTVLTIQKEVAERICALKPGYSHGRVRIAGGQRPEARYSHAMNLLAASVQFWAEPKIIGYISKKEFRPEPKVDSAIIRLQTTDYGLQTTANENGVVDRRQWSVDSSQYYKFIRILFKQPRKTIFNNLRPTTNNLQLLIKILEKAGINPNDRPQNLSIEEIKKIGKLLLFST